MDMYLYKFQLELYITCNGSFQEKKVIMTRDTIFRMATPIVRKLKIATYEYID